MKKNKALRFMLKTSKKEIPWMLLVTLLNACSAALGVYFALAMRNVINLAVEGNREKAFSAGIIFACVVVAEVVVFFVVKLLSSRVTSRLNIAFRDRVFSSLLRTDYTAMSGYHSGELLNRIFNDVSVVSDNVSTLIPNVVGLVTRLVGALIAVFLVDYKFALIFLTGGVILFVFARLFRGVMKKTHKDVQESDGKLRSFVLETLESILVVKAFGMEKKMEEDESIYSEKNHKKKMRRAFFSTGASSGFAALINCGYAYAVLWGATKILSSDESFGYGDFMAIMQLINQIQAPFAGLSGSLSRYYSAIASAERLLEIVSLPSDEAESVCDAEELYKKLSAIELSNVTFAYGETPVFDNASIKINKGELTLISGISGIGKSTMLKMLMGVLRPKSGEISLVCGGERVRADSSTRPLFAYVPQGNFLMSGTIRENMRLAKADATDEDILLALRVASAKFADGLQNGLDTVLGERGSGLSEGQIQRLAIARAVLSSAPILLLDEATSALDEQTEKEVLENIMNLPERTCVCISHRSAAKEICDRIIYVEDGKIKTEEMK